MKALLELQAINVSYSGVKALQGIDLEINKGEIVALMGPNGAGKSTVLKAIFGLAPIQSGRIFWRGNLLKHPQPHEVVYHGIAFVPQGRRVFNYLTVEENLELGGFIINDRKLVKKRINDLYKLFPILRNKRKDLSGSLSGGQQQMLAIARGLMTEPELLLLDEPTLGLSPKNVKEVFQEIKKINQEQNTTIIIVEHNIKSLFNIVNHAFVLAQGKIVTKGTPEHLSKSDILERVFLGNLNNIGMEN